MNTQKIGFRERVQRNSRSVNDCNFEFNNHNSQNLGGKQLVICTEAPAVKGGSQQQSFGHANSANASKSHVRSPTAFYAAERCTGVLQYDNKFGNPTLSPQFLIKNCDLQVQSIQSFGKGCSTSASKPVDPNFQSKSTLQPYVKSYSHKIPCNKRQCVFHLKRLLQSDPFSNSNGRHLSIPLDQNHDHMACCGLNGSLLPNSRHPAKPPDFALSRAVLPTKTRIRWTHFLHNQFVECVNRLGGADKATPKAILKLMDSEGLTIFHVKSHLQKYRIAEMPESAEANSDNNVGVNEAAQIDLKTGLQLKEALQLQLDVQRGLHEQLEIQRNLQLRIEEQGRQLKMMLDQQHMTQKNLTEMKNSNVPSLDDPSS